MPKFLEKYLFERESFSGDQVLFRFNFRDKLFIALSIFLVGLFLQGLFMITDYYQLQNELNAKRHIDQQLDEVWKLKNDSANILPLSIVAIRNGNTLEIGNVLNKLNNHIAKLAALDKSGSTLTELMDQNDAFVLKLKYYSIFNMDKTQYLEFKKDYGKYTGAIDTYEQNLVKQVRALTLNINEITAPLVIGVFLFLAELFLIGWLILAAVRSIVIPTHLITKHFRQESLGPAIPIYSHEGFGKAGIYINEGLAKWKLIGIDIRGIIGKFDHLCQQLIAEVRLREITEIQLQEIYTAIEAYFNDQNTTIRKSNEQLKFLANNFANLQKIPSQLKQLSAQMSELTTANKTQLKQILESAFEFKDESGKVENLFKDLTATLEQVNHVMTVLREVAEQTELLSFNTAIEAAKAGEKGLGFGVVSKEIAKIVVRSRKTSDSLKELIIEIQEKTLGIVTVLPEAAFSKEIAQAIIQSSTDVCMGIFETAGVCIDNMTKLMEVLEDIYIKSCEIAPEADLIAGISSSEEEDLQNIELKILDYQLNVKQEVRNAEKLNDAAKVLRQFLAS